MCFSCFGFRTLFVWNHICFTALSCEIKKNKSVNENLLVHFNVSTFSVCMATNQIKIKCLRIWHTFIIPLSRQESSKVQKSTTGSAEKLLQWHIVEIYTLRKRLVCTLLVTPISLAGVFNCFFPVGFGRMARYGRIIQQVFLQYKCSQKAESLW